MMKSLAALLFLLVSAVTYSYGLSQNTGTMEIGTLDKASYRIDIPKNWNHRLVVYYHGYDANPTVFKNGAPSKADRLLLANGYAIIQSGYSVTGWALAAAFPETEALREYFVNKYGHPVQTYVMGESMGGALTMMTIERSPEYYNGALALCGRLDSSNEARQKAFAMRAAFDYYFPGLLPPLDAVPQNFRTSNELLQKTIQAMDGNPVGASAMRDLMQLHNNKDVANAMLFTTYIVKDAREKAGGNPFDNENYIYSGSPDDRTLNDGVKRYKANPIATEFLVHYYTPTGVLLKPMLALATTYDPVTNPSSIYAYDLAVQAQGRGNNFVQQYVNADGHCNFTPQQVDTTFNELVDWVNEGKRPDSGRLPEEGK